MLTRWLGPQTCSCPLCKHLDNGNTFTTTATFIHSKSWELKLKIKKHRALVTITTKIHCHWQPNSCMQSHLNSNFITSFLMFQMCKFLTGQSGKFKIFRFLNPIPSEYNEPRTSSHLPGFFSLISFILRQNICSQTHTNKQTTKI